MAKELLIDPAIVRTKSELKLGSIPINTYLPDLAKERATYGDAALERIGRDMLLVREFELMLNAIKKEGSYLGVNYTHAGPAHLSIGQEATAVGQSFTLGVEDKIFGSHRSHGEVIAKGLSAIAKSTSESLDPQLRAWSNGEIWSVVEERLHDENFEQRSINYLLYGMAAETFGRRTGYNRGLGGSMHAFFPPLGIYPNNAIVGGSAPLATGSALFNRLRGKDGLVVASIGDAATGAGPVWESFNFAAMGQLSSLMEHSERGGLPVIFFIVNNFYGMGGQTIGETMAYERVARIGAGINRFNMHAQTIDGNNPLAVVDAMRTARTHISAGEGPILIDCQTYRLTGHSPSDASSYRTQEEIDLWAAVDPISTYFADLEGKKIVKRGRREELKVWAEQSVRKTLEIAVDKDISPRLELRSDPRVMAQITFNNTTGKPVDGRTDILLPLAELPQRVAISKKSRVGVVDGKILSGAKAVTFRDALFEAITDAAAVDNQLTIWGEENRDWGGSFGVYRGLTELLPRHRLFNTPISEAAIVGAGVGFAMSGGRALVELMYADFIGRAGDEIFNQMAKWQPMSGGLMKIPLVVRLSVGAKYGAQHSQDWSSMVATVPGLKIVFPATAHDAKGLLASALAGNDPVLFFESQRLYDDVETVHPEGVPRESYLIELGKPAVVRTGDDLTILSVGATLGRALDAADELRHKHGIAAEIIDARTLVPFGYERLLESVAKTGRLLCVSDANLRGSWLHTVASRVSLEAFDNLDAPVVVLGARNWIAPPAELEWEFFVTTADILDAIHTRIKPLAGHQLQDGPGAEGTMLESALGT